VAEEKSMSIQADGMYCNFGLGAISGPLTSKIGGNSPYKHILRMFKIDLVAARSEYRTSWC
jgi:hypothetical protein